MKLFSIISILAIFPSLGQELSIERKNEYPELPYEKKIISFEDKAYVDHFRNMETMSDSIIIHWVTEQSDRTIQDLWSLPEKDKWASILEDIGNRYESEPYMFRNGEDGSAFYLRYDIDSDITSLYSYHHSDKIEKLLISTDKFSQEYGTSYYINYYLPSWDGKHIVVEFNDYSGLTGLVLVLNAETGKILRKPISNSAPNEFGGISWLPDSSGFLYTRFPVVDNNAPGYKQNSESYLYMLDDAGIGFPVFSSDIAKADNPKAYPAVITTSSHEKYPIGLMLTSDNYWDAYISDWESLKSGNPSWKPLYSRKDKVLSDHFKQVDSTFYFISGASKNFELSKVSLNSEEWNPELIVEAPKGETISEFAINLSGIYFTTLQNGVKAKLYKLNEDEKAVELKMPEESGEIRLVVLSPKKDILWAYSSGWISNLERYRVQPNGTFEIDNYGAKDIYGEFKNLKVTETEYISKDGTKVPISLIQNPEYKGLRPTIMTTYGAFGEKVTPDFSMLYLPWVAQGGNLAYPHIRGGGEKGVDWYEAGKKSTKSNSWKDIIAAAEFLIDEDYAASNDIVLMSPSGGGVAGGMALNEAPELFRAFIGEMPVLNPSRLEFGNFSNNYHLEFGSVKDSTEAGHLYAMDPLLNLNLKEKLPNILIISAGNDDRVDGFQMFKYIAALQKFDAAESTYLYNDPDAAHAGIADFYNVYGMVFGFAEHITKTTGSPD